MKKLFLIAMVFASMMLSTSELHAQTAQSDLNQIELHKQHLGTWKSEYNDTTEVYVYTPYGKSGMQASFKKTYKGKILFQCHQLWGYDKHSNRMMVMQFEKTSPNATIFLSNFPSKNVNEIIPVIISDTEHIKKGVEEWKEVFTSHDVFLQNHMVYNKTIRVRTFMRVNNEKESKKSR
ncbi:hypothetical protein [uncultured Bacteroides sp.]|uniref:hypothetical protein n=1 Tax=uncultured Bacteroides sp. TaxID=162156 RepID=UPI002AAB1476|nr:hypothetical protein [uncultured Bacteroides sp.]